jgi:hypothetical protein
MKTLELRDICGYLPYDLMALQTNTEFHPERVVWVTGVMDVDGRYPPEIYHNKEIEGFTLCYRIDEKSSGSGPIKFFKPILRPLSDLYKTIIHNGKEIVPIVELAKIAFPGFEWELNPNKKEAVCNRYDLYYYKIENCFYSNYTVNGHIITSVIKNQYQLFDYMNELKIDYRGLIDAGLAIDANTLGANPYK